MTRRPWCSGPRSTACALTLPSPSTTSTILRLWSETTAASGIRMASYSSDPGRRRRPNTPGVRKPSGLSNTAWARMVAVSGDSSLSTKLMWPLWKNSVSSIRRAATGLRFSRDDARCPVRCRREYLRNSASDAVNVNRIGSMDTSVVSSVAWDEPPATRLPLSTRASDTRPAMGARTWVNSSSSSAMRTSARAARTSVRAVSRSDQRWSNFTCEMALCLTRRLPRSNSRSANLNLVCAPSSAALAAFSCASKGRGSMTKSSWSFSTNWPSLKCMESRKPETRARISTRSRASKRPVYSSHSMIFFNSGLATVTGSGPCCVWPAVPSDRMSAPAAKVRVMIR